MVLLALAGCTAPRVPTDLAFLGDRPEPGFDPTPLLRAELMRTLRDPDSAILRRIGGPVPGQIVTMLGGSTNGWGYCYQMNARNGFGAYTGYQPIFFIYAFAQILAISQTRANSTWNCF
jgi:hypothetical protein